MRTKQLVNRPARAQNQGQNALAREMHGTWGHHFAREGRRAYKVQAHRHATADWHGLAE